MRSNPVVFFLALVAIAAMAIACDDDGGSSTTNDLTSTQDASGDASADATAMDSTTGDAGGDDLTTADDMATGDTTTGDTGGGDAPGDTGGGDMGGGPADCGGFATAVCEGFDTCAPFFLQLTYGDLQGCVDVFTANCAQGVAANGSTINAQDFAACNDALAARTCEQVFGNSFPAACRVAGTLADSAACGTNLQCASAWCSTAPQETCGTCEPTLPAIDDPCINDGCGPQDLYCHSTGVCRAFAANGEACSDDDRCQGGLHCVGAAGSKTCQRPAAQGEACDSTLATAPECDLAIGLGCNPMSGTCDQLLIAQLGEPCGLDIMSATFTLCAASDCDNLTGGTCVARGGVGADCSMSECQAGLVCENDTCAAAADPNTCQ